MAKKKASDPGLTLSEFRAWLQGIEDMQGANWSPDVAQWQKIKAKIAEIVEDEPDAVKSLPANVWRQPQPQYQPAPQLPSAFQPAPPQGQQYDPMQNAGIPGTKIKTPDIDSSNGYQSSLV